MKLNDLRQKTKEIKYESKEIAKENKVSAKPMKSKQVFKKDTGAVVMNTGAIESPTTNEGYRPHFPFKDTADKSFQEDLREAKAYSTWKNKQRSKFFDS